MTPDPLRLPHIMCYTQHTAHKLHHAQAMPRMLQVVHKTSPSRPTNDLLRSFRKNLGCTILSVAYPTNP
jgi:hypothetical protein